MEKIKSKRKTMAVLKSGPLAKKIHKVDVGNQNPAQAIQTVRAVRAAYGEKHTNKLAAKKLRAASKKLEAVISKHQQIMTKHFIAADKLAEAARLLAESEELVRQILPPARTKRNPS